MEDLCLTNFYQLPRLGEVFFMYYFHVMKSGLYFFWITHYLSIMLLPWNAVLSLNPAFCGVFFILNGIRCDDFVMLVKLLLSEVSRNLHGFQAVLRYVVYDSYFVPFLCVFARAWCGLFFMHENNYPKWWDVHTVSTVPTPEAAVTSLTIRKKLTTSARIFSAPAHSRQLKE